MTLAEEATILRSVADAIEAGAADPMWRTESGLREMACALRTVALRLLSHQGPLPR